MPRGHNRNFTEDQEREIVALYLDRSNGLSDLLTTYEMGYSTLYAILDKYNVARRLKKSAMAQAIAELPVSISTRVPTDIVEPNDIPNMPHAWPQRITADANGIVQSVEPIRSSIKTYTWEVRFESAMRVEAASIEAAISEVSKLPMCRRVFNVALKGSM